VLKEYLTLIFGGASPAYIAAAWTFAVLGVLLSLRLHIISRDVPSARTPIRWSWRFFFLDNTKRLLTTLALIFIALRFCQDLIGIQLTMWFSFVIGLGLDKIAQFLKNQNILGSKLNISKEQKQ
jgi:hypothetical protein